MKKSKYYKCNDISNYSGSPGLNKNPHDFFKRNCETAPSLVGSSICSNNSHCKLDKLNLEKYLNKECFNTYNKKLGQYYIKVLKNEKKRFELNFKCK